MHVYKITVQHTWKLLQVRLPFNVFNRGLYDMLVYYCFSPNRRAPFAL